MTDKHTAEKIMDQLMRSHELELIILTLGGHGSQWISQGEKYPCGIVPKTALVDTGGQIKYVVELCNILSASDQIRKIDLFTRLIQDKSCSEDYAQPIEQVNDRFRIVRIQCGGKKYIRKELLWPHLDEFVDKTIKFIRLKKDIPDMVHGHYPDAGYVVMELASFFGIPLVYTGHSLGRSKRARLLDQGVDISEMNRKLKIDHRIEMEETVLKSADRVITSTRQEIDGQYGLYRNRTLPAYTVLPPGIGIERFYPYYHDTFSDSQEREEALYAKASVTQELNRFFTHPDKPIILVLCRPDKRKNIQGLVKADWPRFIIYSTKIGSGTL